MSENISINNFSNFEFNFLGTNEVLSSEEPPEKKQKTRLRRFEYD